MGNVGGVSDGTQGVDFDNTEAVTGPPDASAAAIDGKVEQQSVYGGGFDPGATRAEAPPMDPHSSQLEAQFSTVKTAATEEVDEVEKTPEQKAVFRADQQLKGAQEQAEQRIRQLEVQKQLIEDKPTKAPEDQARLKQLDQHMTEAKRVLEGVVSARADFRNPDGSLKSDMDPDYAKDLASTHLQALTTMDRKMAQEGVLPVHFFQPNKGVMDAQDSPQIREHQADVDATQAEIDKLDEEANKIHDMIEADDFPEPKAVYREMAQRTLDTVEAKMAAKYSEQDGYKTNLHAAQFKQYYANLGVDPGFNLYDNTSW